MIASRYNAQFKELRSLLEAKGAKKAGKVLVSGRKIVPELLTRAVYAVAEEGAEWPFDLDQPKKVVWLERSLFRDLDIFGTHYPLLVLPLAPMEPWTPEPPKGFELVVSLQDPANLGAVLRSADAFGVRKIILLKECAFPFHPKSIRASSGSCFRLHLSEGPSHKQFSDEQGIGLDMNGVSLQDFAWPPDCRLIIGEEGQGLPPLFNGQINGQKISIPMRPGLDSLNASIAASIALFSFRSKIPLP